MESRVIVGDFRGNRSILGLWSDVVVNETERLNHVRKLDTILERFVRGMKAHSHVDKPGLTTTQFFVIRYLSFVDQAKSSEIARIAGLSPGAITQVCDELVRLDFVERVRSDEDRRVVYVALTEAGRQQLKKMMTERVTRFSELLDKLGDEDANTLIRLLDRLVGILDAESK